MNLIDTNAYLIDTHAHLNFDAFKNDYREAISRAFASGVKGIINIGSNLETSKKAIEIAEEYPDGIYAAVGLHPIHEGDEKFQDDVFLELAKHKKVVAIGETGLDYYHNFQNKEAQKELFRNVLKIAQIVSKPVILHSRDAGVDVLSVLMAQRPEPLGVMHCFQGDWPYAKMILDMGLYISFTGLVTFSKNMGTFEVIRETPLDRILIETDCPYMTPEPHRGKHNEPAYVIEVARKIAEIKKLPLEKVAEQTSQNAIGLFGIENLS